MKPLAPTSVLETRSFKKSTPDLCFVICYIGTPPPGLQLFFKWSEQNPEADFLIFSDCLARVHHPPNVTIIPATLQGLSQRATDVMGFEVSLLHPYKLCDFKVAYGEMFREFLEPYTFWGTTDLDVIFGDIGAFITNDLLENHDIINGHSDYIVGHFTLFKNTPLVNSLYAQSRDYRRVYQTESCMSFGECGGHWHEYRIRKKLNADEYRMDSTMHVVQRMETEGLIRTRFLPLVREREHLHRTQWLLYWDHGRLFDIHENREIMYLHYHLLGPRFKIPTWQHPPDRFYINPDGFFT